MVHWALTNTVIPQGRSCVSYTSCIIKSLSLLSLLQSAFSYQYLHERWASNHITFLFQVHFWSSVCSCTSLLFSWCCKNCQEIFPLLSLLLLLQLRESFSLQSTLVIKIHGTVAIDLNRMQTVLSVWIFFPFAFDFVLCCVSFSEGNFWHAGKHDKCLIPAESQARMSEGIFQGYNRMSTVLPRYVPKHLHHHSHNLKPTLPSPTQPCQRDIHCTLWCRGSHGGLLKVREYL